MPQKTPLALVLALTACRAGVSERPEGPLELLGRLGQEAPLIREEAVERVARQNRPVREFIESTYLDDRDTEAEPRKKALHFLEADTASLRSDLERSLGEATIERRVWKAHHAARLACLGRTWASLEPALRRQGLGWKERYEPDGRVSYYRYVLATPVPREHLFFWVKVADPGTREPFISEVFVGVLLAFGLPLGRVAEDLRFPPGSVLSIFLAHPAIRDIAALYPTLEEVELAYGRIRDREEKLVPSGFHVNATFLAGPEGHAGRGVYGTIESRLDPPESSDGRWLTEGFRPEERWGEFIERGRSLFGPPPSPGDRR